MRCWEIATEINDNRLLALSLYLLGINEWRRGDVASASTYHLQAFNLGEEAILPNVISELILVESALLMRDSKVINRPGMLDNVLHIRKKMSDPQQVHFENYATYLLDLEWAQSEGGIAALEILALTYQVLEKYAEAEQIHSTALTAANTQGMHIVKGWVHNDLGLLHFLRKNYFQSLHHFTKSIELKKFTGDIVLLPVTIYNRAMAHKETDNEASYQKDIITTAAMAERIKDKELHKHIMSILRENEPEQNVNI